MKPSLPRRLDATKRTLEDAKLYVVFLYLNRRDRREGISPKLEPPVPNSLLFAIEEVNRPPYWYFHRIMVCWERLVGGAQRPALAPATSLDAGRVSWCVRKGYGLGRMVNVGKTCWRALGGGDRSAPFVSHARSSRG